jgi:hypothetical protein
MRLLYRTQPSLEEVKLMAWHHMIQDPFLITYTVDEKGKIHKEWVNEDLALKRALSLMSQHIERINIEFIRTFKPAFEELAEVFQKFGKSFYQAGLHDSLSDEDKVR